MRTVILGAGGLGGVFGGMPAASGAAVTLIARPAQAKAIGGQGLTITRAAERAGVPIQVTVAAVAFVRERGRRLESQGFTEVRISALQDLERGRRTGLPEVLGPILAAAARQGVAVPTLAALAEALLGLEESRGEVSPAARV